MCEGKPTALSEPFGLNSVLDELIVEEVVKKTFAVNQLIFEVWRVNQTRSSQTKV